MKIIEFFADFETRNNADNTQGIVDICTITHENITKEFTYLNTDKHIIKQLLDYVVAVKKSSTKRFNKNASNHLIVYFHNGAKYDNYFIMDYLLENGFVQRLESNFNNYNNNEFNLMGSDDIKILSIVLKYEDCLIHIKDSYKKLTYSIAKIGEFLDREKLSEIGLKYYNQDFYKLNEQQQQEYLLYAKEDTIIQKLGMQHFTKFLKSCVESYYVNTVKIKNINHWKNHTLSQAAKNIHLNIDWYHSDKYNIDPSDYNPYHYKGGYTICNPIHLNKVVENVRAYDINSSYPSIMLKPIPCEIIDKETYEPLAEYHKTRLLKVYIKSAKLKKGYVPIIRRQKGDKHNLDLYIENNFNRNRFENDKFFSEVDYHLFPFFFWEEEFMYIVEFYEIDYYIAEVTYFKKWNIFNGYIGYFKEQKETADNLIANTTNKNEIQKLTLTRNFSKLAMNCLSGKFGQKIKNENWLTSNKKLEKGVYLYDDKLINIIREKEPLSKNSYLYKFAYLNEDFTRYINKQLPNNYIISYITAKGRCKIFEVICKLKENFVYCDTDSIYCINEKLPDRLIDKSEFGKWKFEGEWKYFKCLKSKCYILTNQWDLKNIDWRDKNLVKTTIAGFTELMFLNEINNLNDFKLGLSSEEWHVKKGEFGGRIWEKRKKIL